jgi:hypothetical protein
LIESYPVGEATDQVASLLLLRPGFNYLQLFTKPATALDFLEIALQPVTTLEDNGKTDP